MPSLVPIDHDPFNGETGSFSLAPVEYDPFAAEQFANPAVKDMIGGLATLPRRAIENSAYSLQSGNYDPGPTLEAATLPMGTGAIAGVPVRGGEAVLGAGPIRAYHGSPHDFDAFSMDKIGTGEGAQAYGHGLYFADNEGVAKSYRDALSDSQTIDGQKYNMYNPTHVAAAQVDESGSRAAAIADTEARLKGDPDPEGFVSNVLRILKKGEPLPEFKTSGGKMYEVNINADPAHFLDWDKPLSEQPAIMEAAQRMGPDVAKRVMREKYSPGKQFLDIAANEHLPLGQATDANISAALRDAGIPGIKYLDQGSRGAGEGSSNYVVFNDKLIDIVRKYAAAGIALPPAIAAEYQSRFKPVDHDPFEAQ